MDTDLVWLVIGFAGQAMFFGRFLIQWIVSERRGESTVPPAFWWMSLAGGLIVLCYAIFRRDPVFSPDGRRLYGTICQTRVVPSSPAP